MKGKLPLEQSGKIESTLPKKAALPFTKKTPTKTPLKSSAATTYNIPSFENIMGLESGGSIADNSIEEEVEADESSGAIRLESQGGTKRHESSAIFLVYKIKIDYPIHY